MPESPRHPFKFPKDVLFDVLNLVLQKVDVGVGEIVEWTFYREVILSEPTDEAELKDEIEVVEELEELREGDRVLLELHLRLRDHSHQKPLLAFAKFVILPGGDLKVENVIVDELPLDDPSEINNEPRIRTWFDTGISAARLILEILKEVL